MNKTDMVPGKMYRITMEDCCIQGVIFGTFIQWITEDEEGPFEEGENIAKFDIGHIGPAWGAWKVEEL